MGCAVSRSEQRYRTKLGPSTVQQHSGKQSKVAAPVVDEEKTHVELATTFSPPTQATSVASLEVTELLRTKATARREPTQADDDPALAKTLQDLGANSDSVSQCSTALKETGDDEGSNGSGERQLQFSSTVALVGDYDGPFSEAAPLTLRKSRTGNGSDIVLQSPSICIAEGVRSHAAGSSTNIPLSEGHRKRRRSLDKPRVDKDKFLTFIPEASQGQMKLLDVILFGRFAADAAKAACSSSEASKSLQLDYPKQSEQSTGLRENRCYCNSRFGVARIHFHTISTFTDELPRLPAAQLMSTACVVLPHLISGEVPSVLLSLERRIVEIRARSRNSAVRQDEATEPELLTACLTIQNGDCFPSEEDRSVVEAWRKGLQMHVLARAEPVQLSDGDALYRALAREVTGLLCASD